TGIDAREGFRAQPVQKAVLARLYVRAGRADDAQGLPCALFGRIGERNAAPRCGAGSKRTGKPCRGAAMPNGRCKLHGGKSTGPRAPEGLERSRRANWKHGHFSREAKAERSRLRAAILALRDLCDSI